MIFISKEILIKDIVDRTSETFWFHNIRGNSRARRRASKVMFLYFKYMLEILIEKKFFRIEKFGTLRILKRNIAPKNIKFTPRYYKADLMLRNDRALNTKMIGEIVSVEFTDGYPKKNKIRFRICKSFREALTKKLRETDYGKTIPLCQ